MSLYSSVDSAQNRTNVQTRLVAASSQSKTIVHVNETEAKLDENKSRGITGPGWWSYFTYTDSHGSTRHKAELLINFGGTGGAEVTADDAIAADTTATITFNSLPASMAIPEGQPLLISLQNAVCSSTGTNAPLSYQWQFKKAGGRFVNIAGATAADYSVTYSEADHAGSYRVKVNSSNGAEEVTSSVVFVATS